MRLFVDSKGYFYGNSKEVHDSECLRDCGIHGMCTFRSSAAYLLIDDRKREYKLNLKFVHFELEFTLDDGEGCYVESDRTQEAGAAAEAAEPAPSTSVEAEMTHQPNMTQATGVTCAAELVHAADTAAAREGGAGDRVPTKDIPAEVAVQENEAPADLWHAEPGQENVGSPGRCVACSRMANLPLGEAHCLECTSVRRKLEQQVHTNEAVSAVFECTLGGDEECEEKLCVICQERPKDHVIVPCFHMCVCGECVPMLGKPRQCPLCRTPADTVHKVFM